ncbi:MAG: RnfABCDGE type electron transport complex subunit D [Bacilli bacterium]|nr:RnfABCDGE type electron transport complex subunit D [Bacilli bacterium]
MQFVIENSPHIRRKDNLTWMLLDVIIALAPVVIFSYIAFHLYALRNLMIPVAVMVLAEYIFCFIRFKPKEGKKTFQMLFHPKAFDYKLFNLLSSIISGLIYGLMFPAQEGAMYFYILPIGALFGIIIGKLLFGGFGNNIFNPAAAGFIFAKACFSGQMTGAYVNYLASDVTAGATSLQGGDADLLHLLLGTTHGAMGEVCKIAILVGLAYLLIRQVADWRVVVSYGCTFAFLSLMAGIFLSENALNYMLYHILAGGFLYGLVYMMTDPVTMPITAPSRIYYGMIGAIAAVIIRLFAGAPEGVGYSILIANLAAPALDYFKWKNRFSKKHFIAYGAIILVAAGIVIWAAYGKANPANAAILVLGGAL